MDLNTSSFALWKASTISKSRIGTLNMVVGRVTPYAPSRSIGRLYNVRGAQRSARPTLLGSWRVSTITKSRIGTLNRGGDASSPDGGRSASAAEGDEGVASTCGSWKKGWDQRKLRFGSGIAFLFLFIAITFPAQAAPKKVISPIISRGPNGHLVYHPNARGDRVPDFSTCGYAGGNRPIPNVPVRVVVSPMQGDETARIQEAIDYVAGLPADTNGFRGTVLLLKGRHEVFGQLRMTNSGVVLRGQGMNEGGTVLVAAGIGRRTLIRIKGRKDLMVHSNSAWRIADNYVPVGATSFHVKDAKGLRVGDSIRITRPSTRAWIDALGMNELGGGLGDWRLVWHPGSYDLVWDRVIQKIDGNLITVDSPITTAMETRFGGGTVAKYSWPGRIHNIGVENLRLESAFDAANPKDESHSWFAITMENAMDAWVRQVTFEHFAGSAVAVYETCKRVTVKDCLSRDPVSEIGGWRRNTYFTQGQQTLFLDCWAEHGRHDFATGFCAAGPNAFVQCEDELPYADSGGIQCWSSGTLFDNVRIHGGALSLKDRGYTGQGAGWSAANSVLWQCDAAVISCENPPTAQNWAFGSWAEFDGNGIWRSSNEHIRPVSLYVAQVADRLGKTAAARIQLMSRSQQEYSNPTRQQAEELMQASQKPAPQLSDFIAQASERDPIPSNPGGAQSVDDIRVTPHASRLTHRFLSLTNGWLVCDGKLLIGSIADISWWRGNMRPSETGKYGISLTRFAPGRYGPGFTDNLKTVADGMVARGQVALDHHYGLWYDRRREDHERVRRMNGNVWAPFFEQPFARSGKGTAWDGLSKYDLTKYNPWYWSRLQQFAKICDQRGLVLFNENYFQHNILEAGAHWVDCPWRTANNINHTGFPEPPPFAGDKRIFMADLFYDTNNAVRRRLHRLYIRQCLNNFINEPNVIQFTSAEFTGPLSFMQFWLDTIRDWEQQTGHKELVALSCTKDVQDAVLADPKRSSVVDVIDFRYWWKTDHGLFAPKGGLNLSPRQFERKWKGGPPSDLNLAQMAEEYRDAHPKKAVICHFSQGRWAFLCGGGSMPNLPKTTDPRLLKAIPQMQPWAAGSSNRRWVLRQGGRQYLICLGPGASRQLDLSAEQGTFVVHSINPRTGTATRLSARVAGGQKVMLPEVGGRERVLWLTREQ